MSTFPNFSNIAGYATKTLTDRRKGGPYGISKLNAWVRITSAVRGGSGDGLTMVSNPNFKLFGAAGVSSIYGDNKQSGTIGETWAGGAVNPSSGQGYRPSPIVESIEIDEGAGNLSRKASFSIKCFSKEQMEITTKYFLEPGFTIFLEWGWNTPDSMKGLVKSLNATDIASHQNFDNLTKRRKRSNGEYDNYLGYITGGGVSYDGTAWIINVKCTGFTELPAYLKNGDNNGDDNGIPEQKAPNYENLAFQSDLNTKRWMFAFNALPSNRKTPEVRALEGKYDSSLRKIKIAHAVNYINFDPTIADKINAKADGTMLSRALNYGGARQTNNGTSARIAIPAGTKVVGDEKFIRFGTLMEIFNTMIMKGLKVGNENVSMYIHSDTTTCSAFDTIFSTDKSKLLIPNERTPKFSLINAKNSTTPVTKITDVVDNSISYDGVKIQFPFDGSISDSVVKVRGLYKYVSYVDNETTTNNGVNKDKRQWGFLDDLYVNFDFANGILGASNFTVKDALYQILNGMSSAVNDLWNFQIIQTQAPNTVVIGGNTIVNKGDDVLAIREVNFTYKPTNNTPYQFSLIGTDSIFKDSSLDMDMSGAKMNQVIGTRLARQISKGTSPNMGKLFAKGQVDLVLTQINSKKEIVNTSTTTGTGNSNVDPETLEELKEKNYAKFLGKLGTYPKVHIEKSDVPNGFDINKVAYVSTYEDSQLLKISKNAEEVKVSILLPINFSFSIHGISGIKRGDKFTVKGIPDKYYKQGFFQVLSVKHTIQNMEWVTQVEGGYRNTSY